MQEKLLFIFYNEINSNGVVFGDTKALFNVGFTLEHPTAERT